MPSVNQIEQTLAGTQCRECGFDGCKPYAEALAAGEAAPNLCRPGGEVVAQELADLLALPYQAPAKPATEPQLAVIDLTTCVGCTVCLKVCPTGAIIGASKMVHSVIAEDCTGCGLCVDPCPVDCISLTDNQAVAVQQAATPTLAQWLQTRRTAVWGKVNRAQTWLAKRRVKAEEAKLAPARALSEAQQELIAAARAKSRQKYGA